jgi:hypothetical protein
MRKVLLGKDPDMWADTAGTRNVVDLTAGGAVYLAQYRVAAYGRASRVQRFVERCIRVLQLAE